MFENVFQVEDSSPPTEDFGAEEVAEATPEGEEAEEEGEAEEALEEGRRS